MTLFSGRTLWLSFALFLAAPLCEAANRSELQKASAQSVQDGAEIALAPASAAATTVASAPGAWGGARTGREPTLSDRVVDYTITASLDPVKHIVDGHELLTWRNRSDRAVRVVYMHLYLNAFEGNESTFFTEERTYGFEFRSAVPTKDGEWGHIELARVAQNGAAVPWSFVHPDGGPQTDHTVARFELPTPVAAGASTTLEIDFHDQLPRVVARTGYFGTFHLVGQWFPKIAVLELPGERGATAPRWNAHEFHKFSEFYADYGNFDVKLTVPKGFTVGATGVESGAPEEADGRVTHHFVQGDVHDFAWTADSQSGVPLEATYTGEGSPPVKVTVIYPKDYADSAAPVLKATLDSLAYFSRTLGPYPYHSVTAVVAPYNAAEAGGMEYPTFFTTFGSNSVPKDTFIEAVIAYVTIHEFGHGYFYGILGSNEFEEPMLDEGLNEYWDMRMERDTMEPVHLTTRFMRWIGFDPRAVGFQTSRAGAMLARPTDPLGANSWNRYSGEGYDSVYARSVITMHDLEARLGRPVLERAFKEYYARWKFRHPGIADLRDTLIDVSGQRALVERAFAEQVYATAPVNDRIESIRSEEEVPLAGTARVEGKWVETTQEEVDKTIDEARKAWEKAHPDAGKDSGPYPWRTIVTLRRDGLSAAQKIVVTFSDGSTETVTWDDGARWARYSWVKPVKGVSAVLDPENIQMLDKSLLDNSRTVEPNPSASRRWSADASAIFQTLLAFIASL